MSYTECRFSLFTHVLKLEHRHLPRQHTVAWLRVAAVAAPAAAALGPAPPATAHQAPARSAQFISSSATLRMPITTLDMHAGSAPTPIATAARPMPCLSARALHLPAAAACSGFEQRVRRPPAPPPQMPAMCTSMRCCSHTQRQHLEQVLVQEVPTVREQAAIEGATWRRLDKFCDHTWGPAARPAPCQVVLRVRVHPEAH
jgi:hypothetical protein